MSDRSEAMIEEVDTTISSVRTRSLDISFNELADMYEAGELIINPEFQRLFRWSPGAQSRFIESLLLELPVPPIFLIERQDRVYELIDGLQRLSSYLNFRGQLPDGVRSGESPLVLAECDIVTSLNGKSYQDLPRALDIKIKRSYIRAEILGKESDPRLRYYMFKRLNTGGEMLSPQEVRNATIRLLSNDFNQFIADLSHNDNFVYCTGTLAEGPRQQMFDQELVLRFFAFKNDRQGYKHDVSDFLTEYMEQVSDKDDSSQQFDYDRERAVFEKTFAVLRILGDESGVGDRVFGSVLANGSEPRGQFSVYHFEGVALGIQPFVDEIDLTNQAQISALASALRAGKADPAFKKHTGAGKNDPNPLRERIQFFERAFGSALGHDQ